MGLLTQNISSGPTVDPYAEHLKQLAGITWNTNPMPWEFGALDASGLQIPEWAGGQPYGSARPDYGMAPRLVGQSLAWNADSLPTYSGLADPGVANEMRDKAAIDDALKFAQSKEYQVKLGTSDEGRTFRTGLFDPQGNLVNLASNDTKAAAMGDLRGIGKIVAAALGGYLAAPAGAAGDAASAGGMAVSDAGWGGLTAASYPVESGILPAAGASAAASDPLGDWISLGEKAMADTGATAYTSAAQELGYPSFESLVATQNPALLSPSGLLTAAPYSGPMPATTPPPAAVPPGAPSGPAVPGEGSGIPSPTEIPTPGPFDWLKDPFWGRLAATAAGGLLGGMGGSGGSGGGAEPYTGPMPTITRGGSGGAGGPGGWQSQVTPQTAPASLFSMKPLPTAGNAYSGLWRYLKGG